MYNVNAPIEGADDILSVAVHNIHKWYNHFSDNYERGQNDKLFTLLTQWNIQEQRDIARMGLPLLQFNKLYDYTKKVIGNSGNITPNLQIRSKQFVSEGNDAELLELQRTIDLVTNLIRNISYNSETFSKYKEAFSNIIYSGYGALHVKYDYENNSTFHKMPKIDSVSVAEKAFFDPCAVHKCKIDGDFCGVYYEVDREWFRKNYPDIEMPVGFPSDVPRFFTWYNQNTLTIVDYYCKEYFKKDLVLLDTGQSIDKKEIKEYFLLLKKNNYAIPNIVDERTVQDYKIMHYKMIKNAILEKAEFPTKTIMPVIFVDGDSNYLYGKQYTQSFVRHAIDSQRFLNYTGVSIAQALKNLRKEQYLATPAQTRGFEKEWLRPELIQGHLPYNPDPKSPPPIKVPPSEIPMSLFQHYERAEQDIQSILGMYNQNMGEPVQMNQIAINAKQQQSESAVAVYRQNYILALEVVGKCILEMIPKIFDTERTIGILKQDGTTSTVKINYLDENGNLKNDLTKDIFELSVEAGPSYENQKQTELALLSKLVSADPQLMPLLADLIADNLELINRPQIVERLRTIVPAAILAKEQGKAPPPPAPNPMAQMASQALQQKNQEMQLEQAKLNSKQVDQSLKAKDQQLEESNQRLASAKLMVEHEKNMSNERQKHLEHLANVYRSGVDLKGNELELLNKLLDINNQPTQY